MKLFISNIFYYFHHQQISVVSQFNSAGALKPGLRFPAIHDLLYTVFTRIIYRKEVTSTLVVVSNNDVEIWCSILFIVFNFSTDASSGQKSTTFHNAHK